VTDVPDTIDGRVAGPAHLIVASRLWNDRHAAVASPLCVLFEYRPRRLYHRGRKSGRATLRV